jgi:hypothetical protein
MITFEKKMIMKRILFSLIVFGLFISGFSQNMNNVQQTLRTTGFAVHAAHKLTIANGILTGDLSKSIVHQKHAIQVYKDGNTDLALQHSLRSRNLAFSVIVANGGSIHPSFELTDEELSVVENGLSPADLDRLYLQISIELDDQDYLTPLLEGIDL